MNKLYQSFRSERIPKLDALRAISALLVMLYHFGLPIPAGFGVTCFFVISGFLITRLLLEEHRQNGRVSLSQFYARRALRIFPPFYVYWVLVTSWLIWRNKIVWAQAISSFLYVCNYYQGLHHYPSSAYSRTWSLAVEEQFYLLWPWLFTRLAANRNILFRVLVSIIIGIWAYRVMLCAIGVDEAYLYTAFECRADAIFVGCALAMSLESGWFPRFWEGLCAYRFNLILTIGVLVTSFSLQRYGTGYRDMVGDVLEPLLVALIVVQLLGIDWPLLDWLDAGPVRFLGRISYSTYLYHGIAPLPSSTPAGILAISSYALATGSYVMVERPFLWLRDRLFLRSNKIGVGAAQPLAESSGLDPTLAPS